MLHSSIVERSLAKHDRFYFCGTDLPSACIGRSIWKIWHPATVCHIIATHQTSVQISIIVCGAWRRISTVFTRNQKVLGGRLHYEADFKYHIQYGVHERCTPYWLPTYLRRYSFQIKFSADCETKVTPSKVDQLLCQPGTPYCK